MKKLFTFILLCLGLFSLSYGAPLNLFQQTNSMATFTNGVTAVSGTYYTWTTATTSIINASHSAQFNKAGRVDFGTGYKPLSGSKAGFYISADLYILTDRYINFIVTDSATSGNGWGCSFDTQIDRIYVVTVASGTASFPTFVAKTGMKTSNSKKIQCLYNGSRIQISYDNNNLLNYSYTGYASTNLRYLSIYGQIYSESANGYLGIKNLKVDYNGTSTISPTFTSFKTQRGTFISNTYFNTTTLNFNVTTNQPTNKKYTLLYFSNGTIISSGLMTGSSFSSYKNLTLWDNKFKIYFNATNINGSATSSNYTFTIDTTLPTITNNMPTGDWYNYTLKPLKTRFVTCTDTNLVWCNISTDTFNKNATTTNNITYTTNGNKTYTLIATDRAGNRLTTTGAFRVNPKEYLRIYDTLRSLYVSSYVITSGARVYNSSGNYVSIPVYDLGLGPHTLLFTKAGYQSQNLSITFNTTSRLNTTYNVVPVRLTLKVYNENSPTTQIKFNLTIFNSSTSTQYLNQVNFSKYYNETLHGNLTLIVESKGYELRKLYIYVLPNVVSTNVMYLLPTSVNVYAVLFRVYERSGGSGSALAIENVVLNVYKYISGTRTFLGQAKTDSNGLTFFNMNYILGDYEIILTKNGFVTQTLTTIPNVQEYTILMIPEGTQTGYGFSGFSYKFYPENPFLNASVVNFSVSIIDENNALSISTFKITSNKTSRTNISLNSNGGLLFLRNININTTKYLANLTVIRNGISYQLLKVYSYKGVIPMSNTTTEYAKQSLQDMEGWDKLFLVVFSYIAVAGFGVMISRSPAVGLFVGLFPVLLFWQFGLVSTGFLAVITIFSVIGGFYTRGA